MREILSESCDVGVRLIVGGVMVVDQLCYVGVD